MDQKWAIKMPHLTPQGPPPKLDTVNFAYWQYLMESHLKSCSMELWRIILQGYAPVFPDNLTRREEVDCQLNANALHIIQQAMTPKEMAHIRT